MSERSCQAQSQAFSDTETNDFRHLNPSVRKVWIDNARIGTYGNGWSFGIRSHPDQHRRLGPTQPTAFSQYAFFSRSRFSPFPAATDFKARLSPATVMPNQDKATEAGRA